MNLASLVEANAATSGQRTAIIDDAGELSYRELWRRTQGIAAQLRAEGSEESERIRSDADRQRTVILAEAQRCWT